MSKEAFNILSIVVASAHTLLLGESDSVDMDSNSISEDRFKSDIFS